LLPSPEEGVIDRTRGGRVLGSSQKQKEKSKKAEVEVRFFSPDGG
jgi:hypothetical protein